MYGLYLLVAFGLCFLIQHKLPFLHGRTEFLDRMLHCTFCTGFHAGWLTWLLVWAAQGQPVAEGWHVVPSLAMWGIASAGGCYVLDTMTNWLEASASK